MTAAHLTLSIIIALSVPFTIINLLGGRPRLEAGTWPTPYYTAEPRLRITGELIMLGIGIAAAVRVAVHYGYLTMPFVSSFRLFVFPVMALVSVVYFGFWISAIIKVRALKN